MVGNTRRLSEQDGFNSLLNSCAWRRVTRAGIGWGTVLLFFVSYPFVLVAPTAGWLRDVFAVDVPTFFVFSLLALTCLLVVPLRAKGPFRTQGALPWLFNVRLRVILWGAGGFALVCIGSAVANSTARVMPVVELLGYVVVPLYVAVCPRGMLPRRLPIVFAALWAINVTAGVLQWWADDPVVGLTANWNWFASVVIGFLPWVWIVMTQLEGKGSTGAKARAGQLRTASVRPCLWIGTALTALLALVLLLQTGCRATAVVLSAYLFLFMLLPRLSRRGKLIVTLAGCVCGGLVAFVFADSVVSSWKRDIRPPLYRSTLRMIADYPVSGVGPGNFRREYPPYRTENQRKRPVAAAISRHPHNEVLHVFSQAGVPAGMLWLAMLAVLLCRPPKRSLFWWSVHFTAFVIFGHAMFDKTLVQPSLNIAGFFMLGLLWRPRLYVRCQVQGITSRRRFAALALGISAAVYMVFMVVQDLRHDVWIWKGQGADRRGDQGGAYQAYARAAEIRPRDVRVQMLAALRAKRGPGELGKALEKHLSNVLGTEPDYAHVNAETGEILARLGKPEKAIPYFRNEAELYPFNVEVRKHLFDTYLRIDRLEHIPGVCEQYVRAWRMQGQRELWGGEYQKIKRKWSQALANASPGESLRQAHKLKEAVFSSGVDRGFHALVDDQQLSVRIAEADFGTADYRYWYRAHLWRERVKEAANAQDVDGLVQGFVNYWHTRHAQKTGSDADDEAATLGKRYRDDAPEVEMARAFAQYAFQAGYQVAAVGSEKRATGFVQIAEGENVWLVNPQKNSVWPEVTIKELRSSDHARQRVGLGDVQADELSLLIPVMPFDFCVRTQALGALVREEGASAGAPRFGVTPARRLIGWQQRLELPLRFSLTTSEDNAMVKYDKQLFDRVLRQWKKNLF